jgi:hypothetical protein
LFLHDPLFIEVVDIQHYALKYTELALFAMSDVSAYGKLHWLFGEQDGLVTCMKKICVDVYMLEQDEIKTPKQ